jgi:hypothetical protein
MVHDHPLLAHALHTNALVSLPAYLCFDLLLALVECSYGSLNLFDLFRFRTIASGHKISWTHLLEPPQSLSLGALLFFLPCPLSLFNIRPLILKLLSKDLFELVRRLLRGLKLIDEDLSLVIHQ